MFTTRVFVGHIKGMFGKIFDIASRIITDTYIDFLSYHKQLSKTLSDIYGSISRSEMSLFMPPTLKMLMGHIAFGACVRGCVGAWVRGWVTLFVPTVTFKPLKLES